MIDKVEDKIKGVLAMDLDGAPLSYEEACYLASAMTDNRSGTYYVDGQLQMFYIIRKKED